MDSCCTLLGLMQPIKIDLATVADPAFWRAYELRRLERTVALPSDATRLERLLAYEPVCGPAHRHHAKLIVDESRRLGICWP